MNTINISRRDLLFRLKSCLDDASDGELMDIADMFGMEITNQLGTFILNQGGIDDE